MTKRKFKKREKVIHYNIDYAIKIELLFQSKPNLHHQKHSINRSKTTRSIIDLFPQETDSFLIHICETHRFWTSFMHYDGFRL